MCAVRGWRGRGRASGRAGRPDRTGQLLLVLPLAGVRANLTTLATLIYARTFGEVRADDHAGRLLDTSLELTAHPAPHRRPRPLGGAAGRRTASRTVVVRSPQRLAVAGLLATETGQGRY